VAGHLAMAAKKMNTSKFIIIMMSEWNDEFCAAEMETQGSL